MKTRTALETILQPRRSRRREEADLCYAPSVRPIVSAAAAFRRCFANASLAIQICSALFFLSCSMPLLWSAPGDENWDAAFGVPGVEGYISAMSVSGKDLFVGGVFSSIGGVGAMNVARWDGASWHALGPGLGGDGNEFYGGVATLLVVNGELYAGGYFTNSGSQIVYSIAKWDGSNFWEPVSTNFWASRINTLAWDGRYLYAGGSYLYFGNTTPNHIARWDGTNWSTLGNGVHAWVTGIAGGPRDYGVVQSMAVTGGVLYVGGGFDTAGAVRATNIARWNGSNWSPMGNGLPGGAHALTAGPQGLYSGGNSGVQLWDGSSWRAVGGNVQGRYQALGTVYSLSFNGENLFVGGDFPLAGGVPAVGLAKWNGTQWSALGSGISSNAYITALATTGTDLYVAGVFDSAGGKPATNIARWRIPHELKIRRSADKALLSWPATGSNLLLETTLNPVAPNWTILSNPPGLHGGECVVTNPVTDAGQFFRLRGR